MLRQHLHHVLHEPTYTNTHTPSKATQTPTSTPTPTPLTRAPTPIAHDLRRFQVAKVRARGPSVVAPAWTMALPPRLWPETGPPQRPKITLHAHSIRFPAPLTFLSWLVVGLKVTILTIAFLPRQNSLRSRDGSHKGTTARKWMRSRTQLVHDHHLRPDLRCRPRWHHGQQCHLLGRPPRGTPPALFLLGIMTLRPERSGCFVARSNRRRRR